MHAIRRKEIRASGIRRCHLISTSFDAYTSLQVVENQYAFSDALRGSLRCLPRDRWMEIWYEDFQLDPEGVLSRIGIFLNQSPRSGAPTTRIVPSRKWNLRSADERAIETYLHQSKSSIEEDRCRD